VSPTAATHVLERTGSTQDDARAGASRGEPAWTTWVADVQDQGRGRQGRAWIAPPGSALLASILLRPAIAPQALPPLALVVGLAVADAIAQRFADPARVGVKWPNDVHLDGRKVAGILVEATLRGTRVESVVAGFGVNLRRAALPPELADKAVSLEEAGATDLDRMRLLDDVRTRMAARLDGYERGGLATVLPDLRARDAARGRRVRGESATGIVSGIARGIADDGRLEVETEAGLVLVAAGEIVFEPAT